MKTKVIYKITNLVNQKVYIGQTMCPKARWRGHKYDCKNPSMVIHHAMKKYGIENFIFETIASIIPILNKNQYCKIVDEIEEYFIDQYKSHVSLGKGYNVSHGGSGNLGVPLSEEHKQKIAKSHIGINIWMIGKHNSLETEFRPGHTGWNKGINCSELTKQKISKAKKGVTHIVTPETGRKISLAKGGKSDEVIEEMKKLYEQGMSMRKIAKQFNISHTTVSTYFKDN